MRIGYLAVHYVQLVRKIALSICCTVGVPFAGLVSSFWLVGLNSLSLQGFMILCYPRKAEPDPYLDMMNYYVNPWRAYVN